MVKDLSRFLRKDIFPVTHNSFAHKTLFILYAYLSTGLTFKRELRHNPINVFFWDLNTGKFPNGTSQFCRCVFSKRLIKGIYDISLFMPYSYKISPRKSWVFLACETVLNENPSEVERYKNGEKKLMGFFMGQLMKLTKGKVEPKAATEALKNELESIWKIESFLALLP